MVGTIAEVYQPPIFLICRPGFLNEICLCWLICINWRCYKFYLVFFRDIECFYVVFFSFVNE